LQQHEAGHVFSLEEAKARKRQIKADKDTKAVLLPAKKQRTLVPVEQQKLNACH
jgi:hypothetical protein